MFKHGRNAAIYMNGVDISGDLNTITPTTEVELANATVFGSVGHRELPGLFKDSITVEGLLDDAALGVTTALVQASPGYSLMILYGQTLGAPAVAVNECMLKNLETPGVVKDINKIKFSLDVDNYPAEPCLVLSGKAQKSNAINGNSASSISRG